MEPANFLEAIEAVDELSEAINKREDDCLNRVYARFCILHAEMMLFHFVKRKVFSNRPNYWEYWYKFGHPDQFFLMSREVIIENGEPKLNIIFNPSLIKDGE